MRKKFSSKNILLILALITTLLFAGCSWFNKDVDDTKTKDISSSSDANVQTFTIAELKNEFKVLGNKSEDENKYLFKPFYNVEQTTEFTFHFNSKVDPVKAVTVHTDSKCEENSTVYQINDGYYVTNGVDVVVKPMTAILTNEEQSKSAKGIWGYAPIYYLCVRYDLDATTPTKLEEPIIIPFTIKNEISTPNAYADISSDGVFKIKWLAVDDAVSYNVYRLYGVYKEGTLTAEERAYASEINMKKIATLDSSTLEYVDSDSSDSWRECKNGARYDKTTGYVSSQNTEVYNRYYVTAVDKNGNESFYSKCINPGAYLSQLPDSLETKFGIIEKSLPDTVKVLQADDKTVNVYPINFYKNDTEERIKLMGQCKYRYEVPGTLLTGSVTYENASGEYPDEIISTYEVKKGGVTTPQLEVIPNVDVDTMRDSNYDNAKVDIASSANYPSEAKIALDPAMLFIRVDMELAKMIGGTYTKSLDTIESYVLDEEPEYIVVKSNGTLSLVKNDGKTTTETKPSETTPETKPSETTSETKPSETTPETKPSETTPETKPSETTPETKPSETTPETKPSETTSETKPSETTTEPNENKNDDAEEVTEINNVNYVDEQRKSTERQVEEANNETVLGTKYPIVAETAGQKYLALSLINQVDEISLKAFPEYQNVCELVDDLQYVWFQNPYIMGIDIANSMFSDDYQTIKIDYFLDNTTAKKYQEEVYKKAKEVASDITNSSMNTQEKAIAIYDYLSDNAVYNTAAIEEADNNSDSSAYDKYPNSWNTYGILCEGKGVCQSYAYAYNAIAHEAGLDTVMVTGTMDGGGHGWNAIKIDGKWYMIDATNNGKAVGVPYWICNTSTDYIGDTGFVLDDRFVDGTDYSEFDNNDNTKDWYAMNNLRCDTIKECVDIMEKEIDTQDQIIFIYNESVNTDNKLKTFENDLIKEISARGLGNKLGNWEYAMFYNGMVMFQEKK